ncbi:MAG: Ig-like domain-containing protein [Vicinamibacterales bacterium]
MKGWIVLVLGFSVGISACGDKSPAAPTPTTSSIAVTVSSPLKVGATAQATAAATLSNGQTQSISSGWRSDAVGVATVTDSGSVTGIGNGQATIYLVSGGRQGQKVIRVVPDYQGQWNGRLRVTACSETGLFMTTGFCSAFMVNSSDPYALDISQSDESITGRLSFGTLVFNPFSTTIEADGGVNGTATRPAGASIFSIDATLRMNSVTAGNLTGTVVEVWRAIGFTGEGRLTEDIVATSRLSTAAVDRSQPTVQPRTLKETFWARRF